MPTILRATYLSAGCITRKVGEDFILIQVSVRALICIDTCSAIFEQGLLDREAWQAKDPLMAAFLSVKPALQHSGYVYYGSHRKTIEDPWMVKDLDADEDEPSLNETLISHPYTANRFMMKPACTTIFMNDGTSSLVPHASPPMNRFETINSHGVTLADAYLALSRQ